MKPEYCLTLHSTACFSFGWSSTATLYRNDTWASGNISVGPSHCISDKGHEPGSRSSYWLSEVRPPLGPGTDLSGSRGMRSWLAWEEMCQRGHMTPEYEVPPLWHRARTSGGMCNYNTPCERGLTWDFLFIVHLNQGFIFGEDEKTLFEIWSGSDFIFIQPLFISTNFFQD